MAEVDDLTTKAEAFSASADLLITYQYMGYRLKAGKARLTPPPFKVHGESTKSYYPPPMQSSLDDNVRVEER